MPQPPPIEPSDFAAFAALEGTSVDVHVAGDYELEVLHEGQLVRGKPTRLKVEPSGLSAAHCTLHGSGLHHAYVEGMQPPDREIYLAARDAYGNWLGDRTRVVEPNLRDKFAVHLRNTDINSTNPMVEVSDLGDGLLRAFYGVRLLGKFVLTVELEGVLLLRREVVIGRASDKPDDVTVASDDEPQPQP